MLAVFRKELKFTMNFQEFAHLRPRLAAVMQADGHSSGFGYLVRSLYFDSVYDRDYYDTVDGLQSKAKIRLRTYGPGSPVKLELKRKEGGESLKYSLILSRQEAEFMQQGDYDFLTEREEEVAQRIYIQLISGAYLPKTLVEYDREAYVFPAGDVRVTFDSGTRATASNWDLFSEYPPWIPAIAYGTGVLEVKYSSLLPDIIQDILRGAQMPSANSKYVQARQIYQIGGDLR